MKYITFVRHAKSSWSEQGLSDHDRPLNERGNRDAPVMAGWLAQIMNPPDLLVASTAVRAQETARVFQTTLGIDDEHYINEPRLYLAAMQDWINVLQDSLAHNGHIAFFSHNPGITQVVNWLCDVDIYNIPTCGVAVVAVPKNITRFDSGLGNLIAYETPKSL